MNTNNIICVGVTEENHKELQKKFKCAEHFSKYQIGIVGTAQANVR
jgi:hypothetical protein